MTKKLLGKAALITGAAAGIGRATAWAFANEGAKVAVVDINAAAAQAVAEELVAAGHEAFSIATDVSRSDEVAAMEIGRASCRERVWTVV